MPRRSHDPRPRGRGALAWGLLCFFAIQLAVTLLLESYFPELRDGEAACKTHRLRERIAEHPDRPHVLILGSSRIGFGLQPDVIVDATPPGETRPFVYNFAHNGSGPILELVLMKRILHERIRPDWIILEVHPALLHQEGFGEDQWIYPARLSLWDVLVLRRYHPHPKELWSQWLEARANPLQYNRFWIMNKLARTWQPWSGRDFSVNGLDPNGWVPLSVESVSPEEYRRRVEIARHEYGPCLRDFHVSMKTRQALHETLDLCKKNGIHVLLLTMPEGHEFLGWYTSEALGEIDAFLTGLCQEYGLCWVDARGWMADEDFLDSHHLLPGGARRFTERFSREVWRPLARAGYAPPAPGLWATAAGREVAH
jgi:hypothetical protein